MIQHSQTVHVCVGCGNCCRWPGYVHVTEEEVDSIATNLGMPPNDFLERHTRLTDDRKGLSLNEKTDGSCEFLTSDDACSIEGVKPQQCRNFPNHWAFDGWQAECPAVALKLRRGKAPKTHSYVNI
ncbi:MAG: Fe-S-cluster containining protein [Rhodothermales bacterium]|jgi:Fe-S-cluster containining protein